MPAGNAESNLQIYSAGLMARVKNGNLLTELSVAE